MRRKLGGVFSHAARNYSSRGDISRDPPLKMDRRGERGGAYFSMRTLIIGVRQKQRTVNRSHVIRFARHKYLWPCNAPWLLRDPRHWVALAELRNTVYIYVPSARRLTSGASGSGAGQLRENVRRHAIHRVSAYRALAVSTALCSYARRIMPWAGTD